MLTPEAKASLQQKFLMPGISEGDNNNGDIGDYIDCDNDHENNGVSWGFVVSDDDEDDHGCDDCDGEYASEDGHDNYISSHPTREDGASREDRRRRKRQSAGVLIVPGEEDSATSTEGDAATTISTKSDDVFISDCNEHLVIDKEYLLHTSISKQLKRHHETTVTATAAFTKLSFPRTNDSLPTDIDSFQQQEETQQQKKQPRDSNDNDSKEIDQKKDTVSIYRHHHQIANVLLPLLIVISICTTILSVYLVFDRYSSISSVRRLENQLRLYDELLLAGCNDKSGGDQNQKEEHKEVLVNNITSENEESCYYSSSPSLEFTWDGVKKKKFTLLDNCWFHADISVHFGTCATNAKDIVSNAFVGAWSTVSSFKASDYLDINATATKQRQHQINTAGMTFENIYDFGMGIGKVMKNVISSSVKDPCLGYVLNTTRYFIEDTVIASQYYYRHDN